MKKFILTILFVFLFFGAANADWTISAAVDQKSYLGDGKKCYRIKLSAASDGSDPATFLLSTYLTTLEHQGSKLLMVISDPGSDAPDALWDYTVQNELSVTVVDGTDRSATVTEVVDGDGVITGYPIVYDLYIDFGDIGDSGDDVDLYFYVEK